jgi:hypothetical protein
MMWLSLVRPEGGALLLIMLATAEVEKARVHKT